MESFNTRYKALNSAQKAAVDTIEGPLMVVAGPGTGKTELLSVRVANILDKTDVSAQNILCLTFTDSGVRAMRDRLSGLIGNSANKVAIHTFHNFGQEIISNYGEFFYQGAQFKPADELVTYEILSDTLRELPHGNLLKSQLNGKFTYLNDIKKTISNLKRGGLYPDELGKILDDNSAFTEWLKPQLQPVFTPRMHKNLFADIQPLVAAIRNYPSDRTALGMFRPLNEVIADSLENALNQSEIGGKTKPLTEWKNRFLTKDSSGNQILKDEVSVKKISEVKEVYRRYLADMERRELYDFDDMILRVIHALETHDELRYQLQETYQYILVDEFQDTNDAQMRLLWNLTNNPSQEGSPNIMIVGDDDQAIYRFQGADMSNIMEFTDRYRNVTMVTLTDNYRSHGKILDLSRSVITQASDRLENRFDELDKTLNPKSSYASVDIDHQVFETSTEMRINLAKQLKRALADNPDHSQAVIARNHRHLKALLPYLRSLGLPLTYEYDENILDSEPVKQLELIANIVVLLSNSQHDAANALIPELLSHPAWQIEADILWRLSLQSYNTNTKWLETMLGHDGALKDIACWMLDLSKDAHNKTMEEMVDQLFGTPDSELSDMEHDDSQPFSEEKKPGFTSPLYSYFFDKNRFENQPLNYLSYLNDLKSLRETIRAFRPSEQLVLADFVECLNLHHELDLQIHSLTNVADGMNAITLLTAHKAKGLEFDNVYIVDAQEEVWGSRAHDRGSLLPLPNNLPLELAGNNEDERLRLLYVALTRAKQGLHILASKQSDTDKNQSLIGVLEATELKIDEKTVDDPQEKITAALIDWRAVHYDVPKSKQQEILQPILDRYRLSATHLNNFIDISNGGPGLFLMHNLLRFPQAMSTHAAYGSAIHKVMQIAHQHFKANQQHKPIEDLLANFEKELASHRLNQTDRDLLIDRGSRALQHFFSERQNSFTTTQNVEHSFARESIVVDGVRLSGAIDLLDIDEKSKTIHVTDYKTGKSFTSWQGRSDYDKIKLHKYEQQLMLYKILIENSRHFIGYEVTGGRLEFVEPNENDQIVLLDYQYDTEKLADFQHLLKAVWQHIHNLDFQTNKDYPPTLQGIKQFEEDLRNGQIDFLAI